jgi:hypothetical protein
VSGAGRKLAVVFCLLLAKMVISGVVGAEPERNEVLDTEARIVVGEARQQAASVTGEQYAGEDEETSEGRGEGGDGGGTENDEGAAENRPDPGPSPDRQDRAPRGGSGDEELRGEPRNDSRQSASQKNPRQQNVQRQNLRQSVSRESESGARASAEARRIQSPEIRSRVKELRKAERAGRLRQAATSHEEGRRQQELRIARERIVAQPVDEASLRRYKKLYDEAAEEYGFGEDWYVLAAVGKVESDHGQNMGPSSAGALGPMQFMPSAWASYGLDANGDGRANIMDPEDAIPSAARYLKVGGAPDDWYKALYTYNHAGWYVEKVLRVSERYRLAAGDEEAGPYYPDGDR